MYVIEPNESITVNHNTPKYWVCYKVESGMVFLTPEDVFENMYNLTVPLDKIEYETYADDGGEHVEFYCSIGDCRRI